MSEQTRQRMIGERIARAQAVMGEQGIDVLFVTPSSDLTYLLDYPAHASERLTLLAIPQAGKPLVLVPRLEAVRLKDRAGLVDVHAWGETESPTALAAQLLPQARRATVAIGDQTWAVFLLHLMEAFPDATFVSADRILRELRMVKDAQEIALMREASRRTDQVWQAVLDGVPFRGRTERQVAEAIAGLVEEQGLDGPAFLIVASGPNSASPHYLTGERAIDTGDAVVVDFGGRHEHYASDLTRTVHVGGPSDEFRRVYETVLQANQAAFAATRPGAECQEIDRAARAVITAAGYGEYFIHRVGHGLGMDVHEAPYMVEGNDLRLEDGMVWTDEPGIYLPDRFGVRIEDVVVVTADGAEKLNQVTRELVIVD